MKRLVASLLILGLAATPALARKPPKDGLAIKPGLTPEVRAADGKICSAELKAAQKGEAFASAPYIAAQPTAAGRTGAAIAAGAIKGMNDVKLMIAVDAACAERLGYYMQQPTPEEAAAYSKLKTEAEREQFLLDFSARYAGLAPTVAKP